VSQKNAPNLKQYSSRLKGSILMTFGRNIQVCMFQFHVGLLFNQLCLLNRTTKIMQILTLCQTMCQL